MEGLGEKARKYARHKARYRRLKSELGALGKTLATLEEELTEMFLTEGVSSLKTEDGNPYLQNETWPALVVPEGLGKEDEKVAKDEARAGAVEALRAMGYGHMVTYNQMSVRGLLKDLADPVTGELPPPLGTFVKASTKPRVRVRDAKEGGHDDGEEESLSGDDTYGDDDF